MIALLRCYTIETGAKFHRFHHNVGYCEKYSWHQNLATFKTNMLALFNFGGFSIYRLLQLFSFLIATTLK